MPFYPNLRIQPNDSDYTRAKKKRVVNKLKLLRSAIQSHLRDSRRQEADYKTTRLATWNLREFGKKNYGGRSYEALYYTAEIISHFDLIALQEIRSDLTEFRALLRLLGPSWDFIATDVTDGRAGNDERMVFLYNRDTVQFRNIAGELTLEENQKVKAAFGERLLLDNGLSLQLPLGTDLSGTYSAATERSGARTRLREDLEIPVPPGSQITLPEGTHLTLKKGTPITRPTRGKAEVELPTVITGEAYALRFAEGSFDDAFRQFARTPFLIAFRIGWLKLNLCTVHIYYGSERGPKLDQRRAEIEMLTRALASKARREFAQDRESFMGVLGDFNIVGKGHPTMEALESNDFYIPDQLKEIPGSNVARDKAYDQIAFWMPEDRMANYSTLEVVGANVFDFFQYVFTLDDEATYRAEPSRYNHLQEDTDYTRWRTYKMSDHLPMWVEIRSDFSDAYLEYIARNNQPPT